MVAIDVSKKPCKDCRKEWEALPEPKAPFPDRPRPTPHAGPRCSTHHREMVKRRKERNAERRNQRVYGLGPGDYTRLYEIQGGVCALCRRATGATKRLAVDHDHATGLARGLLCSICNRILGHARDDRAFFYRAYAYLGDPPANQLKRETR